MSWPTAALLIAIIVCVTAVLITFMVCAAFGTLTVNSTGDQPTIRAIPSESNART